jgi:exopolyphosphatase / guanosine-5'-triphosphate,3'-diphosphate pyrophosphatase
MKSKSANNPHYKFVLEAHDIMLRHDPEPSHSKQVTSLALQMFDQLKDIHLLGAEERDILEAASLLHDIGWSVSGNKHHKHSARLIEEYDWKNARPAQVRMIAAVARYHRKAQPKETHRLYSRLDEDQRIVVRKLAAVIRVADGLDRGHQDRVKKVVLDFYPDHYQLRVLSPEPCTLEIWGADRKKAYFEEVFGTSLSIQYEILK